MPPIGLIEQSGLDDVVKEHWSERLEAVSFMLHEREGGVFPCPSCASCGPHLGDGDGLVTCAECDAEFDPDDAEMPVE